MLVWLLLLGIFTYLIVQRSVASITRTPVWLLWLVMMLPAFIWTAWILVNGEDASIPLALLLLPFIICPILYYSLIQMGRYPQPRADRTAEADEKAAIAPQTDEQKSLLHPLNKDEEVTLQSCFPWTVFYLQNIEHRPQALLCRGQLRSSPDLAYRTVRENIESHFGDRFLVVFQEGLNGKPFFALVPNPQTQTTKRQLDESASRPGIAIGLLLATILTTTWAGMAIDQLANEDINFAWALLPTGLPYGLSLMAILGFHELAHYLTARRYRIRATLPYFIPVPFTPLFPFGTFGAFIQIRSPIPHRRALFDVGIAGPFSGFIVALPILIWGLAHSTPVEMDEESSLFNFTSFTPNSSLLLTLLSKLALGSTFTADHALSLHPVAIAGCLGVIVTALNLMPVGQLDGGHIVHAMFGQRTGAIIGQISRFLVLALSFVQPEFLLWAILLFFIPVVDEPALNDVSDLDNQRDFWGLIALSLLVVIILPAPAIITQILF
jgi:membrane-associated protease RseP (regulator of RpoE activity)